MENETRPVIADRGDFMFKTDPMNHQLEGFYLQRDAENFALLMEQGTGKTKVTIDTAAWQYSQGVIDAMIVIAPNGVHRNWLQEEVPKHMPDFVSCISAIWVNDGTKAEQAQLKAVTDQYSFNPLRVFAMNIESVNTKAGLEFLVNFMLAFKCLLVVDEGSIIKTFDAKRTEVVVEKLAMYAKRRRLLNGTPVTQGPLDVYSQFAFLDPHILRCGNYYAFRNRYAIIEMQGKMKYKVVAKLQDIAERCGSFLWGELRVTENKGVIEAGSQPLENGRSIDFTMKQAGRSKFRMQWNIGQKTGEEFLVFEGSEMYPVVAGYQKLDELQKLIAPYSYRVLKSECLDLPPKTYIKRFVELSENQSKMYRDLKKKLLAESNGMIISVDMALTKLLRLQQITGGFFTPNAIVDEEGEWGLIGLPQPIDKVCPRVTAVLDFMESIDKDDKAIIWARFRPEIDMLVSAIAEKFGPESVRPLHGDISSEDRQRWIKEYETGDTLRWLVANPAAKGVSRGQTIVRGSFVLRYSNTFSLDDTLQAEDRSHRIGQKKKVTYVDFVAPKTLDEKVMDSLRAKKDLANAVTGDNYTEWM